MTSLYRCNKLYIVFVTLFFLGCSSDNEQYSPKIQAIKSYQSTRVDDDYVFINGSFVVSPSPEGQDQLEQLAKIVTRQAKKEFNQYTKRYKYIRLEYQFYEKTDVITEDFTDIYDSWRSIAISPDSGEVPLFLNDVGESNFLISVDLSKSNNKGSECRFLLETKIYHHYWIFGSTEEQFIEEIHDVPCVNGSGWD